MQTVTIPSRSSMPLMVETMPLSWRSREPDEQIVIGYRVWGDLKGYAVWYVAQEANGWSVYHKMRDTGGWALRSNGFTRGQAFECAEMYEAEDFNESQPDPRV